MKSVIFFPIIIIVLIYFSIAFVVPTFREAADIRAQNHLQEEHKNTLEEKLLVLQDFVADINQHTSEREFLDTFIPVDPQEQDIVNAVSHLAEESQVTLFTLGFSEHFNNRNYRTTDDEVPVQYVESTMALTGEYENIYAFLDKLFRINRLYAFNSLQIEKIVFEGDDEANAQNQPTQLSVTVSFQFAYMPLTEQLNVNQLHAVDYENVTRVQSAIATTGDIVTQPQQRSNPFNP